MKVFHRKTPALSSDVQTRAEREITAALESITTDGSRFVVNDTVWYMERNGVLAECVMNAAWYLSDTFQSTLSNAHGWEIEKELAGQKIDAYKEFTCEDDAYHLEPKALLSVVGQIWEREPDADISKVFSELYGRYVKHKAPRINKVHESYRPYFMKRREQIVVRIGVEFETGNIASSFRALSKLNTLYADGHVDVGVFITSDRKDTTAARIWPVRNRNGSFQELEQRQYQSNVRFPIWEFAFQPDNYDKEAPYLNADRSLYVPKDTGKTRTHEGVTYSVFVRQLKTRKGKWKQSEEILLPLREHPALL